MKNRRRCYIRKTDEVHAALIVDNNVIEGHQLIIEESLDGYKVSFFDSDAYDSLKDLVVEDFEEFAEIAFYGSVFGSDSHLREIWWITYEFKDNRFRFNVDVDVFSWKYPVTPSDFLDNITSRIDRALKENFDIIDNSYWHYIITPKNQDLPLVEKFLEINSIVVESEKDSIENLGISEPPRSLNIIFNFPQEVREACEQYLVYFSRFLKDAGENVATGIWPQGARTLFSVIPEDQDQALEKIREALNLFLSAPGSVTWQAPSAKIPQSIEMQRLAMETLALKGRLELASLALMQQQMMNQQQTQIINSQKKIIDQQIQTGKIMIDSIQSDSGDSEAVIPGLLSVKKFEWGALEVDIPNIIRQAKDLFKKDS